MAVLVARAGMAILGAQLLDLAGMEVAAQLRVEVVKVRFDVGGEDCEGVDLPFAKERLPLFRGALVLSPRCSARAAIPSLKAASRHI